LTTPEAVTLAQQLVNRQTTLSKMVDDGFNRLAFNDKDGLPKWFLDDEATHYKTNLPVTKQAMEALRARQRALDARPIKKVAEAKARKKFKAAQRLTKAAKKAETVNEDSELTEKEKASQIMKLMAKGHAAQAKRKELKVVVAKGTNRGVKGRPKGVKGRYLMVDARMRKEMRAKKRIAKASKTRK
jgi:AdoMet-dependent rRNA methyltransferase SPB1